MRTNSSLKISDAGAAFDFKFIDEEAAKLWVLGILYPDGYYCPACGMPVKNINSFLTGKDVKCHGYGCGRIFKLLSGTMLEGTRLSFSQTIFLATLLAWGWNNEQISGRCGVSAETVRLWRKKLELMGASQ